MSKILILHHVEEMWRTGLATYNTNFDEVAANLINYIENSDFDRIILVRYGDAEIGQEHIESGLAAHVNQIESYAYGWDRAEMEQKKPDEEGGTWAEGCPHSEVVLLDDWIKALKGHEVVVTGAFANACVETLTTAMDHCDIDYEEELSLIVGTGISYDYIVDIEAEVDAIMEQRDYYDRVGIDNQDETKEKVKDIILSSDDYNAFLGSIDDNLFSFSEYDDVIIDMDDIAIKDEHSWVEADNDLIHRNAFSNIDVEFYEEKFWIKSEFDTQAFLALKENGHDDIPASIDDVSQDNLAYAGVKITNKLQFIKVKAHLEKEIAKTENYEEEMVM